MLVEITNDYWPVRVNGTIQSIWQDTTRRLDWQWSRLAVSVATTTRAKTISWTTRRKRSRPRRMRSVKPNCLRDKSSVSSVASRLCSCRRRTCVLRTLALSFAINSVIRYVGRANRLSLFRCDSSGLPVADTRD